MDIRKILGFPQDDVPNTGVFYDLSFEHYLGIPAISKSTLFKLNSGNLRKFAHEIEHREDSEEKSHFIMGRALHCMSLEPDYFGSRFLPITTEINGRTVEGRTQLDNYRAIAKSAGKQILTMDQHIAVTGMANALMGNPVSRSIIESAMGNVEVTFIQHDEAIGCYRKCRLDLFVDDCIIADIKMTSRLSSKESVIRQIWERGYYLQAGMYTDIVGAVFGRPIREFILIFVENEPPYQVGFYRVGERMRIAGLSLYRHLMGKVKRCIDIPVDQWPGYNDDRIVTIELDRWMERQLLSKLESNF